MKYLKLLRVNHWIKNFLIFFPIVFNGDLLNGSMFMKTLGGWCLFCFLSSMIYIFNDIRDIESDKMHPRKCRRPLPSGQISIRNAWITFGVLAALLIICLIYRRSLYDIIYLLIYFVLNVGYSMGLKNIALIDVTILSTGFLVRLLYGGAIADIHVSDWMFLTVLSAACYLSFGKRRNELGQYGDKSREALKKYTYEFLDKSMQLFMGLTIVFYSLSCADKETAVAKAGVNLIWSVPIVFITCLRYNLLLEDKNCDGDPVDVVLEDKWLLLLIGIYGVTTLMLLYFGK